jgi:hypothetical protein
MKTKLLKQISHFAIVIILFSGCTKDPYEGVKSNEKSIENITLGGDLIQVGPAVVDRMAGTASVKVLMQANTDLSKVSANIQTSYNASISPQSGSAVNFAAGNNKSTYTVTAQSGESRTWTVELVPFTESVGGTYDVKALVVFGGTGPEYGGGGVIKLTDKPWVWPATGGPAAELDNKLTFEFDPKAGVTADGKTYGKLINSAGANTLYADFNFIGSPVKTDVNKFYRKIPKGESKWERDYTAGTISFIFADGSKSVGTLEGAGVTDLGNGYKKTIVDQAFKFRLSGTDDWGAIYSDYDKFVKQPRVYWIEVKKN